MELTYTVWPSDELEKVRHLFDLENFAYPDPRLSQFVVAVDETGQARAVVPVVLVAHCEPLIADEAARGHVDWVKMMSMCDETVKALGLQYWLAVGKREAYDVWAERVGAKKIEGQIYAKEIHSVRF